MRRTFIPCLYHEWRYHDPIEDVVWTRYDALALLEACHLDTQEEALLLTKDCHQYSVTTRQSDVERLTSLVPPAVVVHEARERLFTTFYEERA
jgi:hypothetical protein